jgi:hypothetical protein
MKISPWLRRIVYSVTSPAGPVSPPPLGEVRLRKIQLGDLALNAEMAIWGQIIYALRGGPAKSHSRRRRRSGRQLEPRTRTRQQTGWTRPAWRCRRPGGSGGPPPPPVVLVFTVVTVTSPYHCSSSCVRSFPSALSLKITSSDSVLWMPLAHHDDGVTSVWLYPYYRRPKSPARPWEKNTTFVRGRRGNLPLRRRRWVADQDPSSPARRTRRRRRRTRDEATHPPRSRRVCSLWTGPPRA